jgi:hypothetical protein
MEEKNIDGTWHGINICLDHVRLHDKTRSEAKALSRKIVEGATKEAKKIYLWLQTNDVVTNAAKGKDGGKYCLASGDLSIYERLYGKNNLKVVMLCVSVCGFSPVSTWEKLSNEHRRALVERVSKLFNELADTLDDDTCPFFPALLLNCDGETVDGAFTAGLGNEKKISINLEEVTVVFSGISKNHEITSILRRLADYATTTLNEKKRDVRPSVNAPTPRAMARHLTEHFQTYYNKTPNEIIASCVCMVFPELYPPPGEEEIRKWRGAR